jgi:hypothetical protein
MFVSGAAYEKSVSVFCRALPASVTHAAQTTACKPHACYVGFEVPTLCTTAASGPPAREYSTVSTITSRDSSPNSACKQQQQQQRKVCQSKRHSAWCRDVPLGHVAVMQHRQLPSLEGHTLHHKNLYVSALCIQHMMHRSVLG